MKRSTPSPASRNVPNAFLLATVSLIAAATAVRAVDIAPGETLTQSFSIGTIATASLPTDWKADKNTNARAVGSYAGAGSATEQRGGNNLSTTAANGIYNFGAGAADSATDRAVGFLSSTDSTKSGNLFLALTNSGANEIKSLTISYKVEKYRRGSNAAGFTIQLHTSADGTTWTSAGSAFTTSFAADADNNGYADAPGATVTLSNIPLNVTVAAGGTLYLAWNYSVTSGTTTSNAQALGIDDVSITANSSPHNLPPELTLSRGSVWTLPDEPISVTASAADPDEGDVVVLSVESEDIPGVSGFFNSTTGVFTWAPRTLGTYRVTFTATDSHAETPSVDSQTLTIHSVKSATGGFFWSFNTVDPTPLETTFGIACGPISRVNGGSGSILDSTSASSGYAGASGGSNAAARAVIGSLDRDTSAFFTFTLTRTTRTPCSLAVTDVSFGTRSTITGPQALALYSSHDNYTTPLATIQTLNNGVWDLKAFAFDAVSFRESITFRLYGYDGEGNPSTTNWRIDDLTVSTLQEQVPLLILIR